MQLQCWKCGELLRDVILPLSRQEECAACGADQHVCRMCPDYDPNISDGCRENRAEFVLEKDQANFCDYFRPRAGAYQKPDYSAAQAARDKLAELFGESAKSSADDSAAPLSEADRALAELKRLFGEAK